MKEIIDEKKMINKADELYTRMIENNIIFNIKDKYYLPEEIKEVLKSTKEKIGRNYLCPCGPGLKYKKCCGK